MRWSTIRLIARRELVDLSRDRRTLMLMFGIPLLLYPGFGVLGFLVALNTLEQRPVVGVVGMEHAEASALKGFTPLFENATFRRFDENPKAETDELSAVEPLAGDLEVVVLPDDDRSHIDRHEVDVILTIPPTLRDDLVRGRSADVQPVLRVQFREGDDSAKIGHRRLLRILGRWQKSLREARFAQAGLPRQFDAPFRVSDPNENKPAARQLIDEARDGLAKAFPFILFMWILTGAIQPAIDMGAGEKERGTMETLLISPSSRGEIVMGKFLAISVFATIAGLWNLLFLGGGAVLVGLLWRDDAGQPIIELMRVDGFLWCAALTPPLACLFAAVCLALGVYAKSTKEGQYYLMPLFLVVVPLIFLSLAGIKLNWWTSLIPLTGASLLLQGLLSQSAEPIPWGYFVLVLLALAGWAALALRWAVAQFSREEVLFREAERFELGLWLRSLFRRKKTG